LGRGIDTRNRSGLFFAAGSYVLGEPGNYEVSGELPHRSALTTTPDEVIALFVDAAERERVDRPSDGRIVEHQLEWQRQMVEAALTAVREHPRDAGGYRKKLQHAGLFLGRIVEQGLLSQGEAIARLTRAHMHVWGPAIWPENVKDIRDAITDGPRLERWRAPEPGPGPEDKVPAREESRTTADEADEAVTSADEADASADEDDEELAARIYEREVAAEMRKERLRREARARLAAEDREPLQVLRGSAFLDAPQPEYLVPSMFYKAATSKVFGSPGSTKSFMLLDIALSLATGRPWQGSALPRTRVHFVMAEGQAVNVTRALAWLHDRGVPAAEIQDWFTAIPQGVLLTPEGVADYLALVAEDRPGFIILDTKNAMMAGEENSASDVAVMVRAMRAIRDASDASVVLVDHTGLTDATRGRGSNAVEAAMDTEIKVQRDDNGICTATVTRDKAAEPGTTWCYTLRHVLDVPGVREGSKPPAVCQMQARVDEDPFAMRAREWWQHEIPLPDEVAELSGGQSDVARDIFRVLWFMGEHEAGVTMSVIRRAIGNRPSTAEPSEATARRARVTLEAIGVVEAIGVKYVLTPDYRKPRQ
jgi:hypothetical protein